MPILHGGTKLLNPEPLLARLGIKEGMKVADLGAGGLGFFAFPAAFMAGEKGKVFAVDVQKSVLRSIESLRRMRGVMNIELVWSDLEKVGATNIEPKSIDRALLTNVLLQNRNWQAILKETSRLLKQGGRVLVIEWKSIAVPFGPPLKARLLKEVIEKAGQETGLKPLEHFEAGMYHYGIIFEKL
jgi:ubiquinone/menaquinone biosynthesis C-methylase UbiE